jgi:hypothetical protein
MEEPQPQQEPQYEPPAVEELGEGPVATATGAARPTLVFDEQ